MILALTLDLQITKLIWNSQIIYNKRMGMNHYKVHKLKASVKHTNQPIRLNTYPNPSWTSKMIKIEISSVMHYYYYLNSTVIFNKEILSSAACL